VSDRFACIEKAKARIDQRIVEIDKMKLRRR
jgi:hypothetical protein